MSFFKSLFGVVKKTSLGLVKGVGRAGLNVVGNYVGIDHAGNIFDGKGKHPAAGGVDVASAPSLNGGSSSGGWVRDAVDVVNSLNPHVTVDHELAPGVVGGLPKWAIPVGIGAAVLGIFAMSGKGKRRY